MLSLPPNDPYPLIVAQCDIAHNTCAPGCEGTLYIPVRRILMTELGIRRDYSSLGARWVAGYTVHPAFRRRC